MSQSLVIRHPSASTPPGPLTEWNPSVKLVTLTVVSLLMLTVWDPVTPALIWALLLASALAVARLRPRIVALAHLPFLAFGVGLFLVNALSRPGEVLWAAGPLSVTVEGVTIGLALVGRTLVIGLASVIFVCTTEPVALMTSLHQNLRLPARLTYAVLAGYQLLLDLPEEWRIIRAAQRIRRPLPALESAQPGSQSRDQRGRSGRADRADRLTVGQARSAAFALLIGALRRSERISRSLESRGLGLRPRTVYRPVALSWTDVVIGVATVATFGAIILMAGWTVGWGPP